MKRLLLLLILFMLLVPPSSALIATMQSPTDINAFAYSTLPGGTGTLAWYLPPGTTIGFAYAQSVSSVTQTGAINVNPITFTYAAADSNSAGYIYLYDTSFNLLDNTGMTGAGRYEIKMIGAQPTYYLNGIVFDTGPILTVNPSYIIWGSSSPADPIVYYNNIIVGESDHHVVQAMLYNWSADKDLITPASTGVYAINPGTGAKVLMNSNYFYANVGKEFLNSESVYLRNVATGTIINTTVVSASTTQIQYSLADFIANPSATDGQYSICFSGSTNCGYFWKTSSGAVISFDQSSYNIGDTATLSYTITPAYYDTTTYDYSYKIVDIYGTTKTSGVVSNTGTVTVTFSSPTYTAGVYYAEIVATKKSDLTTSIMAYDSMTLSDYVVIAGDVVDAQTALPLSGADVNITQALTTQNLTSGFDGNYTTTSTFLTGGSLTINATMAGYKQYLYSFIPLSSGTKTVTISLEPETPTYSGVAIGGVVRDSQYGNPIVGVTAYVMNGTTYQNVTNSAGWYQVDNLVSGTLYDVWSSGLGYSNSTVHQVLAVGV